MEGDTEMELLTYLTLEVLEIRLRPPGGPGGLDGGRYRDGAPYLFDTRGSRQTSATSRRPSGMDGGRDRGGYRDGAPYLFDTRGSRKTSPTSRRPGVWMVAGWRRLK